MTQQVSKKFPVLFNKADEISLLLEDKELTIFSSHHSHKYISEGVDIYINGNEVEDCGYSTEIHNEQEYLKVFLPFEPVAGDVIEVDTAVHHLGIKTITLKVAEE